MPHKDLSVRAAYLREYKRRNRHRYAARQRAVDSAKHANERAAKYGAPGLLTIDEAAAIFEPGVVGMSGGGWRGGQLGHD